jgi:nucleotide-binding universal stress UspA family protein
MRVLVCTESKPDSARAAAYASDLGLIEKAEVTVLGLARTQQDVDATEAAAARVGAELSSASSLERALRIGVPPHEIIEACDEADYDLVVLSRHAKGRLPPIMSRSGTQILARNIASHLLLVRNPPDQIRRILVCSSAEAPSSHTLTTAGELIRQATADVSVIHVMSQVALRPDSPADELEESAGEAMERKTREGDRLSRGIELLAEAGVHPPIRPVLRHGLVVDEVLAEIEDGGYDLVVLGSHYQPGLTRWMDVLLDNVANALLDRVNCSVLIVAPGGAGSEVDERGA